MVIGNDAIWASGTWSGTWSGQNGPVQMSGKWVDVYVPDGTSWKIRADTYNVTPLQ
jgi:hypothetical protein